MKTTGKTGRDAGGTFREPTLVFMVAACWTEKVESWAKQQLSIMVEAVEHYGGSKDGEDSDHYLHLFYLLYTALEPWLACYCPVE